MALSLPRLRVPLSISFASAINALSIPLIAALLWWTLDRVLEPGLWCPAIEEFKLSNAASIAVLRCQPILLAQLDIAKYVTIGLVGALALSHLVSVAREAKASLDLTTKLGSLKVGGDNAAAQGAEHVRKAADEAAEEVKAAPVETPAVAAAPAAEPALTAAPGFTQLPPGEEPL
jgi:hypothetical protein